MIQAVLFDLGGTLEDLSSTPLQRREAAAYIQKVLATRSKLFRMPEEMFFEALTAGYERYKEYTASLREKSPEEIWGDFYLSAFPEGREVVISMADHLSELWETHFYVREIKPESKAVLTQLRKAGFRIGLITNTSSRSAPYLLLEKYGVLELFDLILTSAGEGHRKPGTTLFLRAAQLLEVTPGQCAYVGDQVAKDMLGARLAGYNRTFLVCSPFTALHSEDFSLVDVQLPELSWLPELLQATEN